MSETVTSLIAQISVLSDEERLQISDAVWATLDEVDKDEIWEEDSFRDPEYRAMIDERIQSAKDDPSLRIPGDEAIARIRASLAQNRPAQAS